MSEAVLSLKERFSLSRFIRGEKPVDQPVTLNQRKIFILPTRHGFGFVLLIVLLLLIAFVYNNNLAYWLTFLLASIFIVSILHTYKNLAGLIISPGNSHPAFQGSLAGFDFHINNPGTQPRFNIHLQLDSSQSIDLLSQQTETVTLYQQTIKRGRLSCKTLTLSSTYPLGLFRAWSPLRFQRQALVYPRPSDTQLPFPEAEGIDNDEGLYLNKGDDFYGLKTYQTGDSIRQIHWKSVAKGQGVFSRQYAGNPVADLWLDYDKTTGYQTEQRLSQLCRWIVEAEKAGLQYGLILPGRKIPCDSGSRHYHNCLEALALF